MRNKIKIVLEDLEQSMSYKFLETAADKNDIEAIAKKRGLVVPSPDIALFKGIYTKADKFNGNGSRLSSKEISKALDTLILKPLTHNHQEQQIMGIVLDAKFEDNKDVVVYGAIFKDNFKKEYARFKKDFEKGEIGLSYEIYGNKIDRGNGKYDWKDVFFCGCGILDKGVRPAMHGSKVLEFAMVKEVGENVAPLISCEKCNFKFDSSTVKAEENGGIKCPQCKEIIGLNAATAETNMIPCNCPCCGSRSWKDVVDNKSNELFATCVDCGKSFVFEIEEIKNRVLKLGMSAVFGGRTNCYQCQNIIKFPVWSDIKKTPLICDKCGLRFIHTKKDKPNNNFIVKSIMEVNMNELQKAFAKVEKADDITEEMLTMYEEASEEIQNTLDDKVKEFASKCKEAKDTLIKEKAYENAIKEIAETMGVDVDKVKDLLSKKETASERIEVLTNGIKKLALEVMNHREDIKVVSYYEKELASTKEIHVKEVASITDAKDKEIAQVKTDYETKAVKIVERKQELGDFAKEMSNEQIFDDKDYEIAKLKKQLADKKVKDTAGHVMPNVVIGTIDDPINTPTKDKAQDEYNAKFKQAAQARKDKRNNLKKKLGM